MSQLKNVPFFCSCGDFCALSGLRVGVAPCVQSTFRFFACKLTQTRMFFSYPNAVTKHTARKDTARCQSDKTGLCIIKKMASFAQLLLIISFNIL